MSVKVDPQVVKKVLEDAFGTTVLDEDVQKVVDGLQEMFDAIELRLAEERARS